MTKELRKEFANKQFESLLYVTRIAFAVAVFLFLSFTVLDYAKDPDQLYYFLRVRGLVAGFAGLVFALSFLKALPNKLYEFLAAAVIISAIFAIAVISDKIGPSAKDYYSGAMIVIYFIGLFFAWDPWKTSATNGIGVTIFLLHMDYFSVINVDSIAAIFFLGTAAIFSSLAAHTTTAGKRKQFVMQKEIEVTNSDLDEALKRVSELAAKDGLTGLKNHRYFKDELHRHLSLARRNQSRLGLIILDVDHFKKFNDNWGHQAGDEVLIAVARTMEETVRATDIVARYGGEEFVVIFPNADITGLKEVGEKLRKNIEDCKVNLSTHPGESVNVTASFGAIVIEGGRIPINEEALEHTNYIEECDRNLYAAKDAGRNRVVASVFLNYPGTSESDADIKTPKAA